MTTQYFTEPRAFLEESGEVMDAVIVGPDVVSVITDFMKLDVLDQCDVIKQLCAKDPAALVQVISRNPAILELICKESPLEVINAALRTPQTQSRLAQSMKTFPAQNSREY